jgi:hypothetical protein
MSGLQTIIDNCNTIKFNRRNVVGTQFTRNEIARVSQTPTKNPWKITVEMPNSFSYNDARALMEEIDTLDTFNPQEITFSNNSKLSWIFRYQGQLSTAQLNALTVVDYTGNLLELGGLPAVSSSTVIFKKNDLIEIDTFPYPFTSQQDITRGTGGTITVTTSRPNIISSSVYGLGVTVGNDCIFNVFSPNMPVYKLIPGGWKLSNGITINNAYLEWSDNFYLYEWVQTA